MISQKLSCESALGYAELFNTSWLLDLIIITNKVKIWP